MNRNTRGGKRYAKRRRQCDTGCWGVQRRARHLLMEQLEDRRVLAAVSVNIDADTTWTNDQVWHVTEDISVSPDVTLTIDPGTIVQFDGAGLTVYGTLLAQGTAEENILFTADRDDTGFDGELGTADDVDTEGNGPTEAYPGYWDPIHFMPGSTANVMQFVESRFGGSGRDGQIVVEQAELTLTDSRLLSGDSGLRITGANPLISNVHVEGHVRDAFIMDLASNPDFSSVTAESNGLNGVAVTGGDLPGDTTWDDPTIVYQLRSEVTVPETMTLTIGAGQIIKMGTDGITVHGRMMAEGTAIDPIMFASYRDDSIGGDTNGDGPSGPGDADWGDIEFTSTSTGSVLNHVELRSGGFRGSYHQLSINGGELTLMNSVIRNGTRGIQILSSDPVITNITLQGNRYEAMTTDLLSDPTIRGFTAVGNSSNALVLFGDTIPANTTWDNPDVVYLPSEPITVPEGVTLTIDAGQVVKWGKVVDALVVQGTLVTRGTEESPVVFTANVDDSIGGDSTGNGPSGGFSGAWGRIELTDTSTGSMLDGLHLRYGGYGSNSHQLFVNGGELTLTNSVLFGGDGGLQVFNSDPTIRNVQFQNHKYYAARIDLMSEPEFENITFDNNATNGVQVLGGSLAADLTWDDPEVVYFMIGDITVPTGMTLDVEAGQIVKASGTTKLIVEGTLQAHGTIDEHVIFTSYWDDSAGGDTDNSGSTAGSQSDWQRIEIVAGGNAILNGFEARYGGRGWDGPAALIFVNGGEATIKNSVIRESFVFGILVFNGTVDVSNSLLVHNRVVGLEVSGASEVIATNNTIDHSRYGVTLVEGNLTLTNNLISGPVDNSPASTNRPESTWATELVWLQHSIMSTSIHSPTTQVSTI